MIHLIVELFIMYMNKSCMIMILYLFLPKIIPISI